MKLSHSSLKEIVTKDGGLIQTGPFGSQLHERDYVPDGIPVIMPKDIIDGKVDSSNIAAVSEETARRLSRHMIKEGTIILPRRGEISKRAFIPASQEGWLCGTGCLKIELKGTEVLPKFLHYYLGQSRTSDWLEQHAVGTTMLNLSTKIVENLPIVYPALAVQQRLVDVLACYDELIENNRRRMALLEESARLLHQEWFVRLRFPSHEHTRIVDGVPDGWGKRTAFEAMRVLSGGTPKTTQADFWDGEIPFYTPKDSVTHLYVTETEKRLTEAGLKSCNSRLYGKDTVFITARGTVGNLNLAQRPMAMNQSCYALVGRDHISQKFLFFAMKEATEHFRQHAGGAVFDAIIVDTFKLIPFTIPDSKSVKLFEKAVERIFLQIENLLLQNQRLGTARDLLLPRLMSGEIEV